MARRGELLTIVCAREARATPTLVDELRGMDHASRASTSWLPSWLRCATNLRLRRGLTVRPHSCLLPLGHRDWPGAGLCEVVHLQKKGDQRVATPPPPPSGFSAFLRTAAPERGSAACAVALLAMLAAPCGPAQAPQPANGLLVPPGLSPGSEGSPFGSTVGSLTRVDGWDYDCEGFANPRVHHHPGYAGPVTIDIGADEMAPLIMAGYLNGTRIFTPTAVPNAPNANGPLSHGLIYMFGRVPNNPQLRPETNTYSASVLVDWWGGVQSLTPPDADVGNYTTAAIGVRPGGTVAERRQDIVNSGFSYEPFMRSLECDFSPHLAPDIHPFWGALITMNDPLLWGDIYASNPWYDHGGPPPAIPFRRDNPTLYHNVGGGSSTSWLGSFGGPMYVLDATPNPPGTYTQASR